MTTPDSYTGLYAKAVVTLPGPDGGSVGFASALWVDVFLVKGLDGMTRVASISQALPTGCVSFTRCLTRFDDLGYLYVVVEGNAYPDNATEAGNFNPLRQAIRKYSIAQDGTYAQLWSTEVASFNQDPVAGGFMDFTRDCSWGVINEYLAVDCGTGAILGPDLVISPGASPALEFGAQYYYPSSGPHPNTMLRRNLYYYPPWRGLSPQPDEWGGANGTDGTHASVTADGTVISQSDWSTLGLHRDPEFVNYFIHRALGDSFLTVIRSEQLDLDGFNFNWIVSTIDPDTCLPINPSDPVYARNQENANDLWSERLPGGGRRFDSGADFFLPWKASSGGIFEPAVSSGAVLVPGTLGFSHNGLVIKDTALPDNFPTSYNRFGTSFKYGFTDTDGRYAEVSAGAAYSHEPFQYGYWDFYPDLPPDTITGNIDSTRQLFTAV